MTDTLRTNPEPVGGQENDLKDHDWLTLLQQHSSLFMAIVGVNASTGPEVLFANHAFCRLTGIPSDTPCKGVKLLQCLMPDDQQRLIGLYRRHILSGVLNGRYGEAEWIEKWLLHEPIVVSLMDNGRPRRIELHLRSVEQPGHRLRVHSLDATVEALLQRCWRERPSCSGVMSQLYKPDSALNQLINALEPGRYEAEGYLLLEGTDVTEREIVKDLIELLINQDSVLEPQKFNHANALIKTLFRADDTLILSAEQEQAVLFMDLEQADWQVHSYAIEDFRRSSFYQASARGQVVNIIDLSRCCTSDVEGEMVANGVRSLLLIPLVVKSLNLGAGPRQLVGLVGITSHQAYGFNQADCSNATALIPALSAAMRHTVRESFTNIHDSVRWRFEQEAERRSWGLPPEAITFEGVWPLYGISDVRGSSEERNRAIQADLVHQFELAMAVVHAVVMAAPSALIKQLQWDLQEHLQVLEQGISVEAEVTLLHYLQQEVESHFPYFSQYETAADAIATYRRAIDPEQGCVYQARARYDRTINSINNLLRQTWNQWQQTMQQIVPHYCDIEATDGIDHMIYAGRSIDAKFTDFHLHSLRYEQLRAVCACARAAFSLKELYDSDLEVTHLVLVQATTVDISHDEHTERLFDVRGSRDTRYEIVKKRIDKACDTSGRRITQPGMLTIVYCTEDEWQEYQRYVRYLQREQLIDDTLEQGTVEPLQGVNGLKYARCRVLPKSDAGNLVK